MDVEKGLLFVEQKWYSPWGLFGCAVLVVGLVALFIPGTQMPARIITLAVLLVALVGVWWYTRQPPRAKEGRAGVAICIEAEPTLESRKVRDHFVNTVRGLIKSGQMSNNLDVLVVSDYLTSTIIDPESAEKIRRQMQAAFLLYGNVKLGTHGGKPTHFLRMVGVVQHTPMGADAQTELRNEFNELLPSRVNVDAGVDLGGFEFVSRWSELCAKYVLAFAAALSGQLDFGAGLFEDVIAETSRETSPFPALKKIRERAPVKLAQVNVARASVAHQQWVRDGDPEHLKQFVKFVDAIEDKLAVEVGAISSKAIRAFVQDRDVQTAQKWVEDHPRAEEPAWHFSRAFLYAYQGDLRKATQCYQKVKELDINKVQILTQVDEFLYWVLAEEPDKVQIYYCLGVIAWHIRGDDELARKEFGEFLAKCPPDQFVKDREVVEEWLEQILAKHKLGDSS